MTSEQRLHIRAELAQAMGWKIIEVEERYCDPTWKLIIGNSEIVNLPDYESALDKLPDPFTNAADNRALVEWLAADDARWKQFDDKLLMALSLQPLPVYDNSNPGFQRMMRRQILTASCEVITLAAAKALGIQEASE